MKISQQLLATTPIMTNSIGPHQLEFLMDKLEQIIGSEVVGDVVELGCMQGTTSLFLKKFLDVCESKKKFHVYDSFVGLPEKQKEDDLSLGKFQKGWMSSPRLRLVENFCKQNVELPIIHEGWFSQIPDKEYPSKICFAFLDGDFYSSITDSLYKIYNKLEPKAIVCVHDYGWDELPGVEKACKDFLNDKPEIMQIGVWGLGFFMKE